MAIPKQKPKPINPKLDTPEKIKTLANKKGVTIYLDMDDNSEEAKMGLAYSYSRKSKILTIVGTYLKEKDKPLLLEIIKKAFTSGGLLLKKSKEEVLNSYNEYATNNNDRGILQFFFNVIPKDDFNALKMSLYLRDQQVKGKNISGYKRDIRERFGERGANIANLCSAGYFEAEFMPLLYNSVSKDEFYEYYEIAVGKKARALFVHGGMDRDDIEKEFNAMLGRALNYHMKDFRVHGLGKQNVFNIKDFFSNKQSDPEDKYIFKKGYEKTEPSYVIEYVITIIYNESI